MRTGLPRKSLQRWFGLLRLVGIVLFLALIWRVDKRAVWKSLTSADLNLLTAGVLAQCAVLLSKGCRWHVLNEGQGNLAVFSRNLGQCLESYAIGVFTPGRIGELIKMGHVAADGGSPVQAGLLVLAERAMDLGLFVVAAGSALAFGLLAGVLPVFGVAIIVGGLAILSVACGLLLHVGVVQRLAKFPGASRFIRFGGRVTRHRHPVRMTSVVVLLSIAGTCAHFVSCHFLARSVSLQSPFLCTTGAMAIAGLLTLVPVTVLGLGTRELTLLYVLGDYPESQVLAFSALVLLVAQIGGGMIAMILGHAAIYSARQYAAPSEKTEG
jgi:uncharacterized membrane protein YbhN (UPF0104 family)